VNVAPKLSLLNNMVACRWMIMHATLWEPSHRIFPFHHDEDNRIFFPSSRTARIKLSSAGDIAKHRNNSIMVPRIYSPSYPLFSPNVVVVHARPLLPAGSKLLPRPQAIYEPWSSKRGNNVIFLPISVVLIHTRITVCASTRESTRGGFTGY